MTQLYGTLQTTSLDLITKFGKSISIRTITDTTPAKAYRPVAAAADETVQAVIEDFRERDVDGTIVQAGDRRYLIAAKDVTTAPTTASRIVDGSDELEVVNVEPIAPGGTTVVWRLHARPT
jgi:hypothetical protein